MCCWSSKLEAAVPELRFPGSSPLVSTLAHLPER